MLKRWVYIWLMLAVVVSAAQAEVVVLRSGQTVKGELLLNNDEVVILRKKDGTRYQYPKTEVVVIRTEEVLPTSVAIEEKLVEKIPSVAMQVNILAGTAFIPYTGWGTDMQVRAAVGTRSLNQKDIFLGGCIGYHAVLHKGETFSWVPIQVLMNYPIVAGNAIHHRPIVGASIGYALAAEKHYSGGLCGGVELGWWYRMNASSSLSIALTAQWQQAQMTITESINHIDYSNDIECQIISIGAKVGIQF